MDAGMEKCFGVALAGAERLRRRARAPPARAPRRSTTRATPGSSSTAAPAPPWSCRTAARARPRRSTATSRLSRPSRQAEVDHDRTDAPSMPRVPEASAFRRIPSPGCAGTSFKPEHLPAILADGRAGRLLRGPRRELHGRRRAAARGARPHPARPSGVAARGLHVDRRAAAARPGASRALRGAGRALRAGAGLRAPRLVDARDDLLQRPAAAALHPRDARARSPPTSREVQEAIGRPILLENPSTYLVFPNSTMSRDRVPARARAAHRLRPAARRQQRLRLRHQPRLRRARLPRGLPARARRRDPSRRARRAGGRRGRRCC